MGQSKEVNCFVERECVEDRGLALDAIGSSDLTIGQYLNLLDLAQLALRPTAIDGFLPRLVLRLRDALDVDIVTLGLYDSGAEIVRMQIYKAGDAERMCECFPAHTCLSGIVWKNQHSIFVQDVDIEPKEAVFLESLRRLGVRTYYVFPLTTSRHKLGAIGFGSLHVNPQTDAMFEFLRCAASIIAQLQETKLLSNKSTALLDPSEGPSIVPPRLERELPDFDLRDCASRNEVFQEMVGNSGSLHEVLLQVSTVAATDATVLLQGETGTGKELIARAIHRLSQRADRKLVTINCTAIPADLLESELFGHEKGAFTGATDRRIGRLELADKGTLLLDEVGDLPIAIQPKLLRVLQDKEFERLGSNRSIKVDVRLIAATNQDLHRSIAGGRFREDLFYRLNVFPIYVPPLRDRKSDIPALVRYFVSKHASEAKKSIATIPAGAMGALVNWDWPGNIRELQNLMQRSVILTTSSILKVPVGELRSNVRSSSAKLSPEAERELIVEALREARGIIGGTSGAANKLGIKRTTMYSKMKRLNIAPV